MTIEIDTEAEPPREVERLRREVERRADETASLRRSLVHSSRLVRRLRDELRHEPERAAALKRLEERLSEAWRKEAELHSELAELRGELERRDRELRATRTRLARIHSSLPMRVLNRLRWLPPLRWAFARRTRGYWRELGG